MPGGTVSSSAEMGSTPRSVKSSPNHSLTASQWRSISSWACTSWPQSRSPHSVGVLPSSISSESDRLWAGSVDSTTVRSPAAAQRRAVAAATLVLPTPPLPVYRIVRGAMRGADPRGKLPRRMHLERAGGQIPLAEAGAQLLRGELHGERAGRAGTEGERPGAAAEVVDPREHDAGTAQHL